MDRSNLLFCDSNFFVALFHADDTLHAQALTCADDLHTREATLVISNFIFLEIVTVLSQRRGRDVAREAGKTLLSHPFIEMRMIDRIVQDRTWNLFQKVEHKNVSFVDCSTAVLMEYENIRTLLTFDTTDFNVLQKHANFNFFSTEKFGDTK